MTDEPATCPSCRGPLHEDQRRGVRFRRCARCRGAFLEYAVLEALLPGEGPLLPEPPPEHGYPVHYPQEDHGHTRARPRPTFGPGWGGTALARGTRPDATRLFWGR